MTDKREKDTGEENNAGTQFSSGYVTESDIATDEEVKESVEMVNPDAGTLDRG